MRTDSGWRFPDSASRCAARAARRSFICGQAALAAHQGSSTIIHLWSAERTLVRRILRVAEKSAGHVLLEVQRFGRTRPDTLEFRCAERERSEGRLTRERFRRRFRQLLTQQFPDEQIDSLT